MMANDKQTWVTVPIDPLLAKRVRVLAILRDTTERELIASIAIPALVEAVQNAPEIQALLAPKGGTSV